MGSHKKPGPFQIRQEPANSRQGPSNGRVPANKASTPFSTASGSPSPQTTDGKDSQGLDFLQDPTGHGSKDGAAKDFVNDGNRPQPVHVDPSAPTDPIARANRPQTAGSAAQRLGGSGAQNIVSDGMTHGVPAVAPPYRAGTGSQGNSRVPFKNMKGG
jgi:hypothetical protein